MIIFDCDGVLVDSEILANRVLAALLSRHGFPVTTQETLKRFVGMTIPGIVQVAADEGVTLPDDFEEQLREKDKEAFAKNLEPVDGIHAALEQLSERPKCVASSGSIDKIRSNLSLTGLLRFFEPHLYSARDVAHPKPAPDIFYLAAQRMNAAAADCVVIEDSKFGVQGAKRAGMRVLGFVGASHRSAADADDLRAAGADLVFDNMAELPRLI